MVADVRILRYYVRYLRINTSAERRLGRPSRGPRPEAKWGD